MEIFIFKQQVLIFHKEILIEYTTYNTVSPYIWTLMFQTFKDANVCLHVQLHKLVPMSEVCCHVGASSTSGHVLYCAVLYIKYSITVS